jgi:hypothetical protein
MNDRLTNQDVSALLTLMTVAAEIDNTELEALTGMRITGDVLKRLNKQGLVESTRTGNKPYVHRMTKNGLVRCRYEIANAERPARPGYFGYPFFALLKSIDRFLDREGQELTDFFQPFDDGSEGLDSRIRTAYRKLSNGSRDWVRLAELRPLLNGASSDDVDGVLKAMSRAGEVTIAPDPNRRAVTAEDRAAAVRIGGEDNHLIAIEGS